MASKATHDYTFHSGALQYEKDRQGENENLEI